MNTIHKKISPRKKVIIIAMTVLIFLAVGVVYTYKVKLWPFSTTPDSNNKGVNYSPPTKAQSGAAGSTKQSSSTESTGSDTSPNPTPSKTPGQKPTVGMDITATNEMSGILYIRTLIETISSSGTCTLLMSGPNSATYTATSGVQADPSTSTCQGFNVPTSSLQSGAWHMQINFENSTVQASVTKDITIQ